MSDGLDYILDNAPMQDGAEWKNQRNGAFTSSKIELLLKSSRKKGQVFGDSAMSYIYEKVFERLTGNDADMFDGNSVTEWGNEYEPEAIREFERVTGLKVVTAPYIAKSETYGGSPDGLVGKDAIVEVKCPYSPKNFIKAVDGIIDPKYIVQDQSNLNITGRSKCYHITYDPRMPEGMRLTYKVIERDEEMIKVINDRVELANKEVERIIEKLKG